MWSVYREQPEAHEESTALSGRLDEIARELGEAPVTYDEWQIVYRQALQLGRALGGERQLLEVARPMGAHADGRTAQEERMTTSTSSNTSTRELSNRALIAEITGKASLLARKEIELAKTEIRADLQAQLGMVKALAIAAVAALLGVNLLWSRRSWRPDSRWPAGWLP